MVLAPHRVLEDVGPDAEGVLERALVLHQQAAGLVGLEEPLVRIQPDRIGTLDPAQQPPAPLGHHRKAAIGGVDMEPQALRRAEVGQRLQAVDGARACRAGVGGDRDGGEAGGAVLGHGAGERVHLHAEVRSLWTMRMRSRRTPTIIAARESALWLWSLMYRVARSGWPAASRAATKASTLVAEPPLVKSPPPPDSRSSAGTSR